MKYIRNNQADGVLERLLRAEIGRASRTGAPCTKFDPDFSTAYIERNLTPGEVARYEVHLTACPSCRIQVASLARLGYRTAFDQAAERMPAFDAGREDRRSYLGLSRIFSYLMQPQWIAVATASLVLLVAVPIFVILKNARQFQNKRPGAHTSSPANEALREPAPGSNPDSLSADEVGIQPGIASYNDYKTRSAASAGEPVSSDGFKETSAGVVPSDGKAGTAVLNGGLAGPAPAPPPSAAETNGQKTDAENRPSEMDKRSEATQLAQNKLQQNVQQPSAND